MKVKKFLAGLLALVSMALTGCKFSDLAPEEFGEWENYYIYRGNVRSKTTGEDWNYLVEQVQSENKTYNVQFSINDYAIADDDMYLCLKLDDPATSEMEELGGIVKYNVKDKTQTNICVERSFEEKVDGEDGVVSYEPQQIERVLADRLIVQGLRTVTVDGEIVSEKTKTVFYALSLDGAFLGEENIPEVYVRVSEDYFVKMVDVGDGFSSLYYMTWGMTEMEYVCEMAPGEEMEFFEKGEDKVFLFTKNFKRETDGLPCQEISYMKINGVKRELIYNGLRENFRWLDFAQKDYYVTFKYEEAVYTYKQTWLSPMEEYAEEILQDYTMYKMNYHSDSHQHIYLFPESKNILEIGLKGEKLYVYRQWYENASGCRGGRMQSGQYTLDLSTKAFERVPQNEQLTLLDIQEYNEHARGRQEGVKCGQYTYYLDEDIYFPGTAYSLSRYDGEKVEVLQIWSSNPALQPEEAKYCKEMWGGERGDSLEFIVREY